MPNDLRKVPKAAIRLARKAHRKVTENVIMSMSTKSAILALASQPSQKRVVAHYVQENSQLEEESNIPVPKKMKTRGGIKHPSP